MSQINNKSEGKSIIKNNGIEGPTKRNKLGVNMDSDACREVQEFAGS